MYTRIWTVFFIEQIHSKRKWVENKIQISFFIDKKIRPNPNETFPGAAVVYIAAMSVPSMGVYIVQILRLLVMADTNAKIILTIICSPTAKTL